MRTYWLVNYLFDFVLYGFVLAVFVIAGFAFGFRFFTDTTPLVYIFVLLLWGTAQIGLAFVLAAIFNSARTATSMCPASLMANDLSHPQLCVTCWWSLA